MSFKTGFIGILNKTNSFEMNKLIQLRESIGSNYDWIPANSPHITLVYLGKEYLELEKILVNKIEIPSNFTCKYGKLDFIGKALVCRIDIKDEDIVERIHTMSSMTKYPHTPYFHITLGKFKSKSDLQSFKDNIFLGLDIDDITGNTFHIDKLSLVSVTQPDKIYTLENHLN
jgi:2'-5' RNA ligase